MRYKNGKWVSLNDDDREMYIMNVESWYLAKESSHLSMRAFLKKYREEIDAEYLAVMNGVRKW